MSEAYARAKVRNLSMRIERVLALEDEHFRVDGGEAQWAKGWNKALATVRSILLEESDDNPRA